MRRWVSRRLGAAAALGALLSQAPCSGQTRTSGPPGQAGFATNSSAWEGLSEFVALLEERLPPGHFRLRATLDYDELQPNDAVVLVHPERPLGTDNLTRFLAGGGRVAVVDDFGASTAFLGRFGIRRISAPLDPSLVAMGNPNLAIALPAVQQVAGVEKGRHAMAEGIDLVVTNHPSAFSHPELTTILELPSQSSPPRALAVSGVIAGRGRLVAIGDPSLFINLMLRYPGNRALAANLGDYLTAGAPGQPPGRLWLLVGPFAEQGSFGEPSPWDRAEDGLSHLLDTLRDVDERGLPKLLALGLAALCLAWLVRDELGEQLRRAPVLRPSFTRVPAVAAQSGPLGRAALLAAPQTTPLLILLELGAALEEALTRQLTHEPARDGVALRAELAGLGFGGEAGERAARTVEVLRAERARLSEGPQRKPSETELKRIHRETMQVLERLQEVERAQAKPSLEAQRGVPR